MIKIDKNRFFRKPVEAESIDGTPFYKNVLNLVYGLSKSGKTYTTADMLLKASINNDDVIWLDKDYNVNERMLEIFQNFQHVNDNVVECSQELLSMQGNGEVLVFDSLKDFAGDNDIDSNAGSQLAMERVRRFVTAGFTVIVIAHATKSEGAKNGIKIKGNEETIKSKADVVIQLIDIDGNKVLETTETRIMGGNNPKMTITTDNFHKEKVDEILEKKGPITWTQLRQAYPSSLRSDLQAVRDALLIIENGKVIGTK